MIVSQGWRTIALRHLVTVHDGKRIPLNSEERADRVGPYPYWGSGGVVGYVDRPLFRETLVLLGEDGAPFFDRDRPVAFRIDEPVWVNNHIHVLRPALSMDASFLTYFLNQVDYSLYITGSTRDKLTQEDLREIAISVPPLDEQRQIAEYLDRETGKFDELIAKQEQLVATLAERRDALIADTVTRGVSPDGPFLPSTEWFGDHPFHWKIGRVGNAFQLTLGKMLNAASEASGDLQPYMRAGNIQESGIDLTEVKLMHFTTQEATSLTLKRGDVVVVEGGAGYGRSDYLSADLVGWGFQNHVIRARPRPGHYGPFFDFLVKAIRASGQFEALGSFATIPNVSSDKLARIRYAIPPFEEQRAIAAHIRTGVTEIGRLANKVNEVVALLRERRAALIGAAVTGKIDVRGL